MKIIGTHKINEGNGKFATINILKYDRTGYEVIYTPTVMDGRLKRGANCLTLGDIISYVIECGSMAR